VSRIEPKNYITKNKTNVLIRVAHRDDAEQLIEINLKIIEEKLYMLRQPGEATYTKEGEVKNIENLLNCEGTLYIVAQVENNVIGYLDFRNGGLKITKHAGSLSLYILKQSRGIGIGNHLLKALIEWAEKNSLIEKVTLNVFSTNERAQNLYKKLGFTEEGRCPKDMKLENGTYMDSVLMYKFVK